MTRGALARRRRLMMADLASSRRLKREAGIRSRGDVTGEAGELFVAIVWKGVGSCEPGAGNRRRSGPRWVRVALPFGFEVEIAHHRCATQRARRVERLRRIDSPVRAALHRRVTSGAVAGVDLGRVGLMAQLALLRDAAVRGAHGKRLVAPIGVPSGGRAALQRVGWPCLLVSVET